MGHYWENFIVWESISRTTKIIELCMPYPFNIMPSHSEGIGGISTRSKPVRPISIGRRIISLFYIVVLSIDTKIQRYKHYPHYPL